MRPNVVPLSDVVGVVREGSRGSHGAEGGSSRRLLGGVVGAAGDARLRFSRAREDTREVEARARVN